MKLLTLIRHAKSDSNNDLYDLDRPLNDVGGKDAPEMGKYLSENLPKPNLIISSPAVRAIETAEIIASQTGYPIEKIHISDELYLCSTSEYIEVLNKQNPKANHIYVISHNPGTTGFANLLTGKNMADVPTCTAIHISLDLYKWNDLEPDVGKLLGVFTPEDI
jgi:phosphohistidine phosphatase